MLPKQVSTWFGNFRGREKSKLEARIRDITQWLSSRNEMNGSVPEEINQILSNLIE